MRYQFLYRFCEWLLALLRSEASPSAKEAFLPPMTSKEIEEARRRNEARKKVCVYHYVEGKWTDDFGTPANAPVSWKGF